jgi:Fur family transcriptional regulator, ferric uptake regulator
MCGIMRSMNRESQYLEILKENGFKVTAARLAVFKVLDANTTPLSAKEIFSKIPKSTFDYATLYRILKAFAEKKLVHEIDLKRGHALYELVQDKEQHHHHLVCKKCSKVVDFKNCDLVKVGQHVAARNGFASVQEHSLEFYGICSDCASL